MTRSKILIEKRNKKIHIRFDELSKQYPKWKTDAILEELTHEFYITKRTLSAVLSRR